MALAVATGCTVTAHHVDHGMRTGSADDARLAADAADRLGVEMVLHHVTVAAGANLEARAREARYAALPPGVLTGHTADDQAETVLLHLLRGAGLDGLAAITPGTTRPLLRLRRAETAELCRSMDLPVAVDPSNRDPAFRRNRVRHEVLPLLCDVAERDVVPLLARTADLARADLTVLERVAAQLDPTDARAVAAADVATARRALRRWLTAGGYPPDAAAVERVLEVARGDRVACELSGGRRVERSGQRLRVVSPGR